MIRVSRTRLTKATRFRLNQLARHILMQRVGAYLVTDEGREQWYGKCERCTKTTWLSWCHVFSRSIHATAWDDDNVFAWCRGCHRYMDQHWEQKRDACIARIGQSRFDALKLRAQPGRKPDYAGLELSLRQQLKEAS